MSEQPDRNSTTVRVTNDVKENLDTIKAEREYGTYSSAIGQLIKENKQLREEVENYRKIIDKIPDAD